MKAMYVDGKLMLPDIFATPELRTRYTWDETGIHTLFADVFKDTNRMVANADGWYYYDGKRWRIDPKNANIRENAKMFGYALKECVHYLDDGQSREIWGELVKTWLRTKKREAMIKDVETTHILEISDFDTNPYLFNCRNCTIDLNEFVTYPHRHEDMCTQMANVDFIDGHYAQKWEDFIDDIMCGDKDMARYLQKTFGYSLIGIADEECFFMLYGETTRNGKGTLMESIVNMMGDYAKTAQPATIMQRNNSGGAGASEEVARLRGARLVNISEPGKSMHLDEALIKQLTGRDTVTTRFMYQHLFEYKPEYTIYINTNYRPRVSDNTIFSSNRLHLLPFNRHFEPNEQDRTLKSFFQDEYIKSAILNWMLAGLQMYKEEGLIPPKKCVDATEEYRIQSDTTACFFQECMVKWDDGKIKIKEAYEAYREWADLSGYKAKSKGNFTQDVKRIGLYKHDYKMGNVITGYTLGEPVEINIDAFD